MDGLTEINTHKLYEVIIALNIHRIFIFIQKEIIVRLIKLKLRLTALNFDSFNLANRHRRINFIENHLTLKNQRYI